MFDFQLSQLYRQRILSFTKKFLLEKQEEFINVNAFGTDVIQKLLLFISGGKLLRGRLVLFAYNLFSDGLLDEVITAAVAFELIHSSFIIHDDIMDNDEIRRGEKAIFVQYKEFAKKNNFSNPGHFGQSMGISIGDIGFFLGYELLSVLNNNEITKICSKEFSTVALAQMQDVYNGYSQKSISEKDIINLYKYKTGRYTFSLPLIIGSLLANQSKKIISSMDEIGESLGIVFQIVDDMLSLFGNEEIIGKPIGSDVRENKKTLFYIYLLKQIKKEEKEKLRTNDSSYFVKLLEKYRITQKVESTIAQFQKKAEEQIAVLPITKEKKQEFLDLIISTVQRNK